MKCIRLLLVIICLLTDSSCCDSPKSINSIKEKVALELNGIWIISPGFASDPPLDFEFNFRDDGNLELQMYLAGMKPKNPNLIETSSGKWTFTQVEEGRGRLKMEFPESHGTWEYDVDIQENRMKWFDVESRGKTILTHNWFRRYDAERDESLEQGTALNP